jgi:hypothetical protein
MTKTTATATATETEIGFTTIPLYAGDGTITYEQVGAFIVGPLHIHQAIKHQTLKFPNVNSNDNGAIQVNAIAAIDDEWRVSYKGHIVWESKSAAEAIKAAEMLKDIPWSLVKEPFWVLGGSKAKDSKRWPWISNPTPGNKAALMTIRDELTKIMGEAESVKREQVMEMLRAG